jgi:hypothetical protein
MQPFLVQMDQNHPRGEVHIIFQFVQQELLLLHQEKLQLHVKEFVLVHLDLLVLPDLQVLLVLVAHQVHLVYLQLVVILPIWLP